MTIINYKRLIHLLNINNIEEIDLAKFLPNNGLINWNTNIVNVAAKIPNKSELLKTFLDRKLPLLVNNKRGIKNKDEDEEKDEFNKMDILYDYYMKTGLLSSKDATQMRGNYEKKFKDIFKFIPAKIESLDASM